MAEPDCSFCKYFRNTHAGTLAVTSLDISGTVTAATVDVNGGNLDDVTIGATTPGTATFAVFTVKNTSGNALATVDSDNGDASIDLDVSSNSYDSKVSFSKSGSAQGFMAYDHEHPNSAEKLKLNVGGDDRLTVTGAGNVGIGANASNPSNTLVVHKIILECDSTGDS